MACVCSFCCKLCFTQFLQSHCSCSKVLSPSSCSTMSFVFNFYQYGDAITTPPRPRPKTAARPPSALLPPGDWSEPTRRRRRDDPANAGGRRGRSHSPRHRRRRHSRSPRRRAAPSPRRSRSGSVPRPKSVSPSVPPGNFVRGRSQFLELLLHQGQGRCLRPDLQKTHGLRKIKVLEDQQCQKLRHSRKLLMSFWIIC